MRTSRARLLLLVALVIVVFVELRTVLAFFGVDVSSVTIAALAVVTIAALLFWAFFPTAGSSPE